MRRSGCFVESRGKGLAGPEEFAPDGIRRLLGQSAYFLVAQLFVGHQQQKNTVLLRKRVQRFLDTLAEFLDLKHAQGIIAAGAGGFPDRVVGIAENMAFVPGLGEVLAVVDGDPVKPRAHTGVTPELAQLPVGLQKYIVCGVFRLGWIAQKPQGQIVDGLRMLLIDSAELTRSPRHRLLRGCVAGSGNTRPAELTRSPRRGLVRRGAPLLETGGLSDGRTLPLVL